MADRFTRSDAAAALDAGRYRDALSMYRAIAAAAPGDADAWFNVGWLLQRLREPEPALAAYARAIETDPAGGLDARLNRAYVLSQVLGQWDAARDEMLAAIEEHPNHAAPKLNLARLYEQVGDRRRAADTYARVLADSPGHVLAMARQVTIDPARATGPLVDALQAVLAAADASPQDRADAGFALGQLFDTRGEFDAAFAAYAAANAAVRADLAARGLGYDRARHERFVDRQIRWFDGDRPRAEIGPAAGVRPVFVCGMFRSGSTLLEHLLARHPAVTAGGEMDALPLIGMQLSHAADGSRLARDVALLTRMRGAYLREAGRRHPGARELTDKRPDNFLHLGLASRLLPESRALQTTRDPADTGLSTFFCHLGAAAPYASELADIGHWYGQYRRLMAHWAAVLPGRVHEVVYERLVSAPRAELDAALRHLGLPWDDRCLDASVGASRPVDTPSGMQIRQPLHDRSIGRAARDYAKHIGPLLDALGDAAR